MRGKSPGFSQVAVGTRSFLSSYDGDGPSKLVFVQRFSGLLSCCKGCLGFLLETWQGNRDASCDEAGDPGSLSSCHRDIAIPINFQEESGIVSC